jgi:hypothetical protein
MIWFRSFLVGALLSSACFGGNIPIQWIGGTGSWDVASNWNLGVVPNDNGSTTYAVTINSGSVTADGSVEVDTLTIGNGATVEAVSSAFAVDDDLNLQGGSSLSVENDSHLLATVDTIAGTLNVFNLTNSVIIPAGGALSITNTGSLVIGYDDYVSIEGNVANAGAISLADALPIDNTGLLIYGILTNTGALMVGPYNEVTVGALVNSGTIFNNGAIYIDPGLLPTPEPGSFLLGGAALLGVGAMHRCRTRQRKIALT